VAVVDEPGPLVQRPDVRPLLGHAVHPGGGQAPVRMPARHLPAPELDETGRHEGVSRGRRVRPVARLRPVHQPVDVPAAPDGLADLLAGAVAQQVGGGHHPPALLGHHRGAPGHPGVDDELARVALQLAHDGVDRHRDARHDRLDVGVDQRGQLLAVGPAERAHTDRGHGGPPLRRRRGARGAGGRYRCGTPPRLPGPLGPRVRGRCRRGGRAGRGRPGRRPARC
jgi:hypothetical protein